MGLLSRDMIESMGFASVGNDVRISDKASFYNCQNIHIGNLVRIDDFCVLSAGSGGIVLGDYIHIAIYSSLQGAGNISLADYCNISSRVAIYSSSDDYSGEYMTNPMIPEQFTGVTSLPVTLEQHVIVGCGAVILPGVHLHEGVAVGALSLVNKDCEAFGIYSGVPATFIEARSKNLLEKEHAFKTWLAE